MTNKRIGESMGSQALANFMQRVYNACLYNAALAIGSSSKLKVKIVTGATGEYLIDGVRYTSPAAQEVAFTATTDDIIADPLVVQERTYLVLLDSSGVGSLLAGDQAATGLSVAPEVPAAKCAVGKVVLRVAAGTTDFDATTDELDESHITDVYTNLAFVAA